MGRNVFVLTSSIYSDISFFGYQDRISHVLNSIASIRHKDPSSIILLVDNSFDEKDESVFSVIKEKVDILFLLKNNPVVNLLKKSISHYIKGSLETHSIIESFGVVKLIDSPISRIFKITGRYQLMDSFDLSYYENPELHGRYVFKSRANTETKSKKIIPFIYCEFWSISFDLIDDAVDMLYRIFYHSLAEEDSVECLFFKEVQKTKLIEIPMIHVEHYRDDDGKQEIH